VGGGAYAMGKHSQRKQEESQAQAYDAGQQDAYGQQGGYDSSSGASGLISSEATQRLAELGKLHEQGVLTDDEFAVQKAKILGAG
jgi:hypothetical protein